MKKLICIYTCEKDKKSLCNFKQTNLYKELQNDTNTKILEVYAGSNKTQILGNKLLLDCEEKYASLSIKTYKMISECVRSINFDVLIKIDCNIFEKNKIENNNLNCEKNISSILNSEYVTSNYGGSKLSFADSEDSLVKWANEKQIKLLLASDINFNFPFFCGKFYFLSKESCKVIANDKNKILAEKFKNNYGGVEDIFVSCCLNKNKDEMYYFLIFNEHIKSLKCSSNNEYIDYIKRKIKIKIRIYKRDSENCVLRPSFSKIRMDRQIKNLSEMY